MSIESTSDQAPAPLDEQGVPELVDNVAVARLYGEPLFAMPQDLYIPPDALEVFLETFEGPLDLLLYLIRKQNFNILDIPLADVTRQYLNYVDQIRKRNLELASEYLLMAAMLIEIKSRMLLPPKKTDEGDEVEDPRAELVRPPSATRCPCWGAIFFACRCKTTRLCGCGIPMSAWTICETPGAISCSVPACIPITTFLAKSCPCVSTWAWCCALCRANDLWNSKTCLT